MAHESFRETKISFRRLRPLAVLLGCGSLGALLLCIAAASPASSLGRPAHLDRSFAGRGYLLNRQLGGAVVAEDDGDLLLAGAADGELLVARYHPDGRLDRGFGRGGLVRVALAGFVGANPAKSATAGAIVVTPSGKIILAGSFSGRGNPDASSSGVVVELRGNGAPARGFGGTRAEGGRPGQVVLPAHEEITALALQGHGILLGGSSGAEGFLERLLPDGRPDRSFAGKRSGVAVSPLGPPSGHGRRIPRTSVAAILPSAEGKILLAGTADDRLLLERLRQDGARDRTFAGGGVVERSLATEPGCSCSQGRGLARDGRGRILVSGTVLDPPTGERRGIALARFLPDGALDPSFATDGVARRPIGAQADGGPVAVEPDGEIVLAGSSAGTANSRARFRLDLLAYRPDGRLDRGFFGSPVFSPRLGGRTSAPRALMVDPAGRIVFGAESARPGGGHLRLAGLLGRISP